MLLLMKFKRNHDGVIMWVKTGMAFTPLQTQQWLQKQFPDEQHNAGGDCINPLCDYEFTESDKREMYSMSGWFTCPQCDHTYNYLNEEFAPRANRVGLTPGQMGAIGEEIVQKMGEIPLLGPITWSSTAVNFPIDMIAGPYGVEIKTNHSEAQPRFKLGGGGRGGKRTGTKAEKEQYCLENGLKPALVGVRLNFYWDQADIFVRPDSMSDTWIGAPALHHVATENFAAINPFKRPSDVPPPSELPDSDDDDIPF